MIRSAGEVRCVLLRWENEQVTLGTALSEALLAEGAAEGWADVAGTASSIELAIGGGVENATAIIALRASGPVSLDEVAPLATATLEDAGSARTLVGRLQRVEAVRLDAALWVVAPQAVAAPVSAPRTPSPASASSSPAAAVVAARAPAPPEPRAAALAFPPTPPPNADGLPSATVPAKRPVKEDDGADYPEAGDLATHFLFGECEVIESDGDRIRLRQSKDGRIREVSLGVLLVEAPVLADGRKHFQLSRKH